MARANGYIIAKELQKESDNFEVSMDISSDNSMLAFGYGPNIKLVQINTHTSHWFSDKKLISKSSFICQDTLRRVNVPYNQRVVRDVKWNHSEGGKNLIGVAMGETVFVCDVEADEKKANDDKKQDQKKGMGGFSKVFQSADVMRQGDYASRFVWEPKSTTRFLCTSSKSGEIVQRDLREPKIVATFNPSKDDRLQQKLQDLKFNPADPIHFATISKSSTITLYDIRDSTKFISRVQSPIQNYKSNLLDWEWNGNRLASVYGGWVKIWGWEGEKLVQKQAFQHKNVISDLKWLKKMSGYILVSEMQENIIYGYRIDREKHDLQILVDPRHSGLKKFLITKEQNLILGLTNFQDSKKHQHQVFAIFPDYQISESIWSKTKFYKPNSMGLDNQLLFSASKKDHVGKITQSYALLYQQFQSSAKKIQKQMTQAEQQIRQEVMREKHQKKLQDRSKRKNTRRQRHQLQKIMGYKNSVQAMTKSNSQQNEDDSISRLNQSKIRKMKKTNSIQGKTHKSIEKKSLNDKKSNESFSDSSQSDSQISPQEQQWIISYDEQVQYLDKNYQMQIHNKITEQKIKKVCEHNSKIAKTIGKEHCSQFWKYLYEIAFPKIEQKHTLSSLYEDKKKLSVHFRENKIMASFEHNSQLSRKVTKYSLQKLIQNLVDQNQLQTAVTACVLLRNIDQKILPLQFIQPFLVCYKQLLKSMSLTFISTNLSFIAKLNQAVQSTLNNLFIPIGCGICHRKLNDEKCSCLQVCIFCGESLKSGLVIGCKICGHMAHAREHQQWVALGKCPYRDCQHECFKV